MGARWSVVKATVKGILEWAHGTNRIGGATEGGERGEICGVWQGRRFGE